MDKSDILMICTAIDRQTEAIKEQTRAIRSLGVMLIVLVGSEKPSSIQSPSPGGVVNDFIEIEYALEKRRTGA